MAALALPTGDVPPEERAESGQLLEHEHYWRDRQPWLQEHGYMLRPRYRPGWQPFGGRPDRPIEFREDVHCSLDHSTLDAKRLSDGSLVTLKKVEVDVHPFEMDIRRLLSSEEFTSDSRNHCVRILETLPDPTETNITIIVMPYLRTFDDPEFRTFGEAMACLKQLIEGLRVMHEHHIAHRDISPANVMMDATVMFPRMWHPAVPDMRYDYSGKAKYYSRTERPPKYYYVDFGLSRRYDPKDGPPKELPNIGGDKTVPEFQGDGCNNPVDPFRTDIYYLGNLMRTHFVNKYRGFEFMQELVANMVQDDPAKRPTIEEVDTRFDQSFRRLSNWKLRSRLVRQNEIALERGIYGISYAIRTMTYIVKRLPSVPTPSA
ncbi:hypothetical protein DAEQUDRAFT_755590 [Daedalea quercina L-15889]|uniref:Protein kinase domain-containing protein n=1 Tax=Daedalea quercina L-15889 TaxID=1314783 RepID=A0A165SB05_9APHY|nr:hypothetical protein DAEQUDRAFT_755590 [Daedalea quercina L-15889]